MRCRISALAAVGLAVVLFALLRVWPRYVGRPQDSSSRVSRVRCDPSHALQETHSDAQTEKCSPGAGRPDTGIRRNRPSELVQRLVDELERGMSDRSTVWYKNSRLAELLAELEQATLEFPPDEANQPGTWLTSDQVSELGKALVLLAAASAPQIRRLALDLLSDVRGSPPSMLLASIYAGVCGYPRPNETNGRIAVWRARLETFGEDASELRARLLMWSGPYKIIASERLFDKTSRWSEEHRKAFLLFLKNPEVQERVKSVALGTLAQLGIRSTDTEQAVSELLFRGPGDDLAGAALTYLSKCGSPESASMLLRLSHDPRVATNIRASAILAYASQENADMSVLSRLYEELLVEGQFATECRLAIMDATTNFRSAVNPFVNNTKETARPSSAATESGGLTLLMHALAKDPDPGVRLEAARLILQTSSAKEALGTIVHDSSVQVRRLAVSYYEQTRDIHAKQYIRLLLRDDNEKIREAVESLLRQ